MIKVHKSENAVITTAVCKHCRNVRGVRTATEGEATVMLERDGWVNVGTHTYCSRYCRDQDCL